MEQTVNPWKANLTNGLVLGMTGIIYMVLLYFLNMITNKPLGFAFLIIQIVLLYFLIKSYRDNQLHGNITYGQALGAGVITCLYFAVIMALFSYIFFAIIDPGLINKIIALSEEQMVKKGLNQELIDKGMQMTRKMIVPPVLAIYMFFREMFFGVIISLVIAAFVRREGNPITDQQSV
jgi:hypothetical protein